MYYLQGERTLSLLVENCGRVNYGIMLDEQRKGTVPHRWLKQSLYRHAAEAISWWFNFTIHHGKITFNSTSWVTTLTCLPGLVGNITLNKKHLRDFIIYSLDMKADFVNRFASFIYFSIFMFVILHALPSVPCLSDWLSAMDRVYFTQSIKLHWEHGGTMSKIPPKYLMGCHADTVTWCILNLLFWLDTGKLFGATFLFVCFLFCIFSFSTLALLILLHNWASTVVDVQSCCDFGFVSFT